MSSIRQLLTLGGAATAVAAELRNGIASHGGTYHPVGQTILTLVDNHAGPCITS